MFLFFLFFRGGFVFRLPLTRDLVYNWPFVCVVVVRGLRVAEDWQSKTLVTLSLSLSLSLLWIVISCFSLYFLLRLNKETDKLYNFARGGEGGMIMSSL